MRVVTHSGADFLSRGVFKTVTDAEASRGLGAMLEQVANGCGRIEIVGETVGDNREHSCVLLSKAELESLERALLILSGTKSAEEMREQLDSIATAARASMMLPVAAL